MVGSKHKAQPELHTLKSAVETTTALLTQLQSSTSSLIDTNTSPSKDSTINALALAHDSASLIRAHTTKISLLIINKPFSASAITKIFRELVAGPLPGLASAVELCHAAKYTSSMSTELQWRAKKVFMELGALVKAVPLDGKPLSEDQKNGTGKITGKGSLAATGTVWEACDGVTQLNKLGIAGLLIKKVDDYRDLLKDALEELQEWGEEESDGDDDGSGNDAEEDDGINDSAQDAVDNIFGSLRHIPSDDPDRIRPRLDSAQKRLRLVILMYQAVVKRRLKTVPQVPSGESLDVDCGTVKCLDEVLGVLKKIPNITDELASAFYELDVAEIDNRMDECFFTGFGATELLLKNWKGEEDEFTLWAKKFQLTMKKGWDSAGE